MTSFTEERRKSYMGIESINDPITSLVRTALFKNILPRMGCTDIDSTNIYGKSFSFNLPVKTGSMPKRWAGGLGAVRRYIMSNGYVHHSH